MDSNTNSKKDGETIVATKAFVLEDGEVVSQKYLDRYAIKSGNDNSNQLPSDRFSKSYSDNDLVTPLYNPEALTQLLELNTHHYRSVKTKARDTAGLGWYLEPIVDNPNEEQKAIAESFFDYPNPSMTFNEINNQVMVDFESIGYACYEVIRLDEDNVQLEHLPSHTIRVADDFNRFCQIRGNKKVWFKRFGYEGDIDYRTGEESQNIDDEYKASEIIYLMNYTSRSDFYGIPDILPALSSVLAEIERQEYNISFFDNHAIPAYAVTVSGAELDEEVERTIQKFFQQDVKKSNHSTLVLTAKKDEDDVSQEPIDIKFEALSTDMKEASFRMFRQDNRDEILSAHGVPPYRAGITVEGQLGGSSASEATEIYKQSIIKPKQEMLENIFNRKILFEVLGITDWELRFKQIDTRDVDKEIERMRSLFDMGAYSPNMILEKMGEERIDDPNMDRHFINGQPLDASREETQAIMQSLKTFHEKLVKIATKQGD